MSCYEAHLDKYFHNKTFLNEINDEKYADWAVTVCFYCGLHLVESRAAQKDKHSDDHKERNSDTIKLPDFKYCRSAYFALYNRSRQARYDCIFLDATEAKKSHEELAVIENILLPKESQK